MTPMCPVPAAGCMEGTTEQMVFSCGGGWRCWAGGLECVVPVSHPGGDAHLGSSWVTKAQHAADTG